MAVQGDRDPNPLWYLFSKTWHYSEGNRHKVVWYWCLFVVATSLATFVPPYLWAQVMNTVQTQGITRASMPRLWELLILTLVVEIVFWCFHGPARYIENENAFLARAKYRKALLKGVLTLPLEWHTEHHSGDTIDKIEKGTSALYAFSRDSFQVIYSVVQLVGSYAVLVYYSHSAAPIVLGMVLISGWITMRFDKVLVAQYKELNVSENQISESVFDVISNISTVIILRVEHLVFTAISRKVDLPLDLSKRNNRLSEIKWFLTSVCCAVMVVLVLGVYFYQHIDASKTVLVGSVFILIRYLDQVSNLFFRFTSEYSDVLIRKARTLNSEELAKDFREENFGNHVLPLSWQVLSIQGLNFSYHGEDGSPHLDDVSLQIRRGERIALVGETGSGKTTLLKVMRDLYHPQSLELSVDDVSIPHGFEGISRAISLVPQDPEIFATTIRENITLGVEYDEDILRRYTDLACFTAVAESLPKKLESSVKEKGVNLSGGQQQRLALARGFLASCDKDIVLLDEPTSSVDAVTETRIYRNLFTEFEGKTIISSIHKLHLLSLFDRIYVFDQGKIVANGNLEEVLSTCLLFQNMWSASGMERGEKVL